MRGLFSASQREFLQLDNLASEDIENPEYLEEFGIRSIPGEIPPMAGIRYYGDRIWELYKLTLCEKPGGGLIDGRKIVRWGNLCTREEAAILDAQFCAWSISKNVFQFDQSLFDAILDGDLQDVKADMLDRLPYNTMYINTPSFFISFNGKKARVKGILFSHRREFRHLTDETIKNFMGYCILYEEAEGVLKTFFSSFMVGPDGSIDCLDQFISTVVCNLLLYISVYMADIRSENNSQSISFPSYKKGFGLSPAKGLKIWHVGRKIGSLIREYNLQQKKKGSHASPSPHIRRAHWHTYLTGPKKNVPIDQRKRLLKWIPPIPVAMWDRENAA
jgi:hypothetical protein